MARRRRAFCFFLMLPTCSALQRPALVLTAPRSFVQRTKLVAQDGWRTAIDQESGLAYYYHEQTGQYQWEPPPTAQQNCYNEQTGQSQWEPPTAQQDNHGNRQAAWHHPHGTNQVMWRVADFAGSHSRYNLRKHDVQVLSRYNMLKQSLFVSRKQCFVSCLADGTAALTSVGKGPTLWRERSGPWCMVQRGESLTLSDGDAISLDAKNPDGTVFTCEEKRVQQGGSSYHQQDGYSQREEQMVDQHGAVYYYNSQTGEQQWDPPQHWAPLQQGGY